MTAVAALGETRGRTYATRARTAPVIPVLVTTYAALLPLGDISLGQQVLGRLGANASLPFAAVLAVFAVQRSARCDPSAEGVRAFLRGAVLYLLYAAFVTIVLATITGLITQDASGDDLAAALLKAPRFGATLIMAALSVVVGGWAFLNHRRALNIGLYGALAMQIGLLLVEVTHPGYQFATSGWHFAPDVSLRPRILQPESSSAGAVLLATAGALALTELSTLRAIAVSALGVGGSLFVESRGALFTVLLTCLAALLLGVIARAVRRERLPFVAAVASALFVIAALLSGPLLIAGPIPSDGFTSNATRATWAYASARSLVDAPAGNGLGQVFATEERLLNASAPEVAAHVAPGAMSEVGLLLHQSGTQDLSPKTLPSVLVFTGGVVGLLVCFGVFYRLLRSVLMARQQTGGLRFILALFFCAAALVSLSTYVTGVYEYALNVMIGVILVWNLGSNGCFSWRGATPQGPGTEARSRYVSASAPSRATMR